MKKVNFYFMMVFVCFTIISCTNEQTEEQELVSNFSNDHSPVLNLINDFRESHSFSPSTRSINDKSELNIQNITTKTYTFEIDEKIAASSRFLMSSKDSKKKNTLEVSVYTVEFEKNGREGFSIATDDERIKRVYAYTESGKLSDTIYNIGLRAVLNDIKLVCEQDLMQYYEEDEIVTKGFLFSHLVIPPITGLQWGQDAPFNQLAPSCSNVYESYVGRAPAGCTPVAISQAVAYLCPPTLGYNINGLRNIGGYTRGTTSAPWVSNMAIFLRYIGICVDLVYGCNGSGAWSKEIRNEFTTWGIDEDNGWYAQASMEQPGRKTKPYLDDNEQIYITGTNFTIPPKGNIEYYQ
jgi:hypothetical protein